MSKEWLEEANEWLKSMYEILSTKTEVEDIEYLQKRIDLFEWMRLEIYSLYGGETFEGYIEQNKRYREALEEIKGATSHNKYWKYIAFKALEGEE